MAFDVVEAEETEDHYIITLSFRPQGEFDGRAGREQFFIEKEGNVAHRQVLSLPRRRGRFPLIPVAIVLVVVAAVVVGAVLVVFEMGGRGDGEEPASVAVLPTDTPVPPTVTPVPAPTEALTVGAAPAASTATATPVLTPSQAPTSAPAAAPIQAPASVLVATPTYNPQPTATRAPTATVTPRLMPTATITPTPKPLPTLTPTPAPTPRIPTEPGRISFRSYRNGIQAIYSINPDGSDLLRITPSLPCCASPLRSPDGSKIAYEVRDENDGVELFVMEADGNNRSLIFNSPEYGRVFFWFDWSPNGRKIVLTPHFPYG